MPTFFSKPCKKLTQVEIDILQNNDLSFTDAILICDLNGITFSNGNNGNPSGKKCQKILYDDYDVEILPKKN